MNSWFRCVEERPAASLRLFCFPHAGGSAVFFRSWTEQVSPDIEVVAVQYPGRADRLGEPVIDEAPVLVKQLTAALLPLCDRPVALFGHSMGAIVSYEVARSMQAQGTPPVYLFVSACRAANVPAARRYSEQDDDTLAETLMWMGGTDTELLADPEIREMVLPYVRGDLHLLENYVHRPEPLLSVPITSIVGAEDPVEPPGPALGWGELTSGEFAQRVLPGDHFYLVPHRDEVIAEVESRLLRDEARPSQGQG